MAAKPADDAIDDPSWVPNATYPKRPAALRKPLPIEKWISYGMAHRKTVHFYGSHGIGKTSRIREIVEMDMGLEMVYVNLANITPDDKLASAPKYLADGTYALQQMISEELTGDQPFVIYLDDARQASQKVWNQFMQLTCSWTLGQHPLKNLAAVIMSDNEGTAEGIRTSEDLAIADRKVTVAVQANDTGWRYALARKYKDTDLNPVFAVWDTLTPEMRHILSPRALDHVIYAGLHGFPLKFGLPLMNSQRLTLSQKKADGTQVDRTDEVLDRIAAAIGAANPEKIPDMTRKVINAALRDNLTVLIEGPPGCGKTELTKELVKASGIDTVYLSMSVTDPEQLVVPMPTPDGKLKAILDERFLSGKDYAIIFDEYNRPQSPATFAKMMEMTQEWSIAGVPLGSCRAQIAICNPREFLGQQMHVLKNNVAQADRFTLSIQVDPADIPANEWLIQQYGPVAEVVLDWWKSDINEEQRQWITKRTLERFITLHIADLPLESGKIYLGEGEYAPVPLIDLEARLANRPKTQLAQMAADLDFWLEKLSKADALSDVGSDATDQVHQALISAELSQLRQHKEAVIRLAHGLPGQMRGPFFKDVKDDLQKFWIQVFTEGLDRFGPRVRPAA